MLSTELTPQGNLQEFEPGLEAEMQEEEARDFIQERTLR